MEFTQISESDAKIIRKSVKVLEKLQKQGIQLTKLSDKNPDDDDLADRHDCFLEELQDLGIWVSDNWGLVLECAEPVEEN